MKRLSIIIPALNEAEGIVATLESLGELRRRGHEVIVVDGGSSDGTASLAGGLADRVLAASAGRAGQMNAGARAATGDVLLFLHADSRLPAGADRLVLQGLVTGNLAWGRFDVAIAGAHALLRVVGAMMNLRSRLTHICTGDQGIFVRREIFDAVGGYPDQELMEDLAISARLRRVSAPLCLRQRCLTSARRWESQGVLRTVTLMWWLRLQYALGASPARLARAYGTRRHSCRIMVFAKAPTPGRVKTRLIAALGERAAAELHRQLVERTLFTALAAKLGPVELWCAPGTDDAFFAACARQHGVSLHAQGEGDLGVRMARALEHALAAGSPGLLVGSDCAVLSAEYLRQAAAGLAGGNDAVFGPAEDGGYVLIGLARKSSAQLFDDIAWGTATVMQETRARLARLNWRWRELATLWDVDRPEDLPRLHGLHGELFGHRPGGRPC